MSGISAVVSIGGAWTPAKISGLQGWWKADFSVYSDLGITLATNGQSVEQWNDNSPASNNLLNNLGIGATFPTYVTGALNGLPVISYNASVQSQILLTNTLNLGGTTASLFAVVKGSTPNANARIANFTATGQQNDFDNTGSVVFEFLPSTTTVESYSNGALSSGTITDATWFELGSIFDGANSTIYINGTAQTPAADTNSFAATGRVNIGGRFNSVGNAVADGLTGSIAEVVFTNTVISSTDRAKLHTYFSNKWGV